MCVIICLTPGYTLPFDMLENACYNNPHGFGLVLRDPKYQKLQLIKSSEEELQAGNDPKRIYELLKENEDIERYLHVRWKTEGDISVDNVQPFCTYNSKNREVYFMHNGTLQDYKPPTYGHYVNGAQQVKPENSGPVQSDTYRFNEQFLSPLLNRFSGENGKGDILDPVFKQILTKFWGISSVNKGLLVSSDQGFVLINKSDWKTIKTTHGEFLSSNDTYFEKLTRGPVFEMKEKERKEREAAENQRRFQETKKDPKSSIYQLKQILLKDKIQLPIDIKELMSNVDVYSEEGLASLKNVTAIEWEEFLDKNKDDNVSLLIHFTDEYDKLWDKYTKATAYLDKINKSGGKKEARVG